MVVFDYFFWISGGLLLAVMVYLWFLAVVSLIPERTVAITKESQTRFAILIPAHNEAAVIRATLESVKTLDYSEMLYDVIVIADNCTDETAELARQYEARVLERKDERERGKGFALQWAFESLKARGDFAGYDAFVIIDADTVFDPLFLEAMNKRIAKGEMAIQGYYDVKNPGASPMASLSYLGFALSRNLRYKGRTSLGWSSNLLGNGMCFSKEIIRRFGWDATSIVEDMEYAVMLRLNGITVSFGPEALVFAEIPDTFKDSKIQRSRWDIGRFQVRNRYLVQLIKEALRKRDIGYLDMAMELLIPPFSLFVVLCLILFGLFLSSSFTAIDTLSTMWFTIILMLVTYILLGLVKAKTGWRTYINLVYAPFFLMWRVKTVIWGYFAKVGKHWIKTARKDILK
ncbi:MAG: glycosyltransferase family 2 protein [Deltaproteobacteria bacterium]|nr:glycosyltransferase family 2 protein [Deltaproteobacteria bacterium]